MAAVNGMFGSLSGIVSYANGRSLVFHAQGEAANPANPTIWTVSVSESRQALRGVYDTTTPTSFRLAMTNLLDALPFMTFSWNKDTTGSSTDFVSTVTDVVFHLNMLAAFDNGKEYPISVTYQKVGGVYTRTDHLGATDLLSAASNLAAVKAFIEAGLDQIMAATVG